MFDTDATVDRYGRLLFVAAVAVFTGGFLLYCLVVVQQVLVWVLYAMGLILGYVVGRWDRAGGVAGETARGAPTRV